MKIDSVPGLSNAVTGQVSSNKRIQSWEQEFLSEQRRSFSGNETTPKGDLGNRNPVQGESSWQELSTDFTSSRAARSDESSFMGLTRDAAQEKISGEKVAAGYTRVSGQIPVAAKVGRQVDSTFRLDTKRPAMKSELEVQLGKFKGHLVVEEDGLVSVWVGRKLSDSEKVELASSIKTMLVRNGLVLEKLTINGIEEQL